MVQSIIQTSFHAGEFAPALNARVDLAKYHSAAALLRNFFVDYRGGASTRTGTRYVLQCLDSEDEVRLIPFQASFTVGYILEFGNNYIRFFFEGAPILETAFAISGASQANPCVLTIVGNDYVIGDWIFVQNVGGMTQLNGRYFIVTNVVGNLVTIANLEGVAVNSTSYTAYTSGGAAGRVYTINTPYDANELETIKFSQNVNALILCHPNHPPYVLTLIAADNWTLNSIEFGSTVGQVTGLTVSGTSLAAGSTAYSYLVTAVDANGQEGDYDTVGTNALQDMRDTRGSISLDWTDIDGAASYNVYKAEPVTAAAVASGAQYGFIGNVTDSLFIDENIDPDFSQGVPVFQDPFDNTSGVTSYDVTNGGAYTVVPSVTIDPPPVGTDIATASVILGAHAPAIVSGGTGYSIGQTVSLGTALGAAAICSILVNNVAAGVITSVSMVWRGSIQSGTTPANPLTDIAGNATINVTWRVDSVNAVSAGSGYDPDAAPPAVTFSAGAATADAVLGDAADHNPSVVSFYQQRMVLAAPRTAIQTFYLSQPGSYYNFNISNPIEPDDAITGSIVAGQLNEIQSMVAVPTGLMILTSKAAWLVNGGSPGSAITPIDVVANAHSYNGASEIPPIIANFDILFVQAKGSIVRDLSYNFYASVFTGTDISILSSHLFYNFTIKEWAWGEEPFKIVWCVRDDGEMLTLTFLKEQELIGWAHSDTQGLFKSVATVTETTSTGTVDAIYTVVERVINGNTVKYIERFAERVFNGQAANAWCVDAGLQYNGTPTTTLTGAEHLANTTVTGLADGVVIPPFTMPADGVFTLATPASIVTVGLAFTAQLQTLALDTGEPTIQGKRKAIGGVTVRCQDTLGLTIGKSFTSLVPMKDLVRGNVGSATNNIVTDLITADARTIIDPSWDVPGQYCIQQSYPLPATILGVIPEINVGDTK